MNNITHNNTQENVFVLSLGANLGDRYESLQQAISLIKDSTFVNIIAKSAIYETEPVGYTEQANFLNMAILCSSECSHFEIIFLLKNIEYLLDRKPRARWHEREIDIDLIIFNSLILKSKLLIIPHKEMQNRKFVLVPMAEIYADYIHPIYNKTIKQLLKECNDNTNIIRYEKSID